MNFRNRLTSVCTVEFINTHIYLYICMPQKFCTCNRNTQLSTQSLCCKAHILLTLNILMKLWQKLNVFRELLRTLALPLQVCRPQFGIKTSITLRTQIRLISIY